MEFDVMLDAPIQQLGTLAREAKEMGVSGAWVIEARHDPFVALASIVAETPGMRLGTAVAVAFARNPMTLASVANDLQLLSGGRFVLGLGSQVKAHVERRFSMPWGKPIGRMRETILAIRAIWDAWETGEPLRFEGQYYQHTLMTPTFSPGPNPFGQPKIFLGGLGSAMTELAGELADGLVLHRMMSEKYLTEVTLPALRRGMAKAGRDMGDFELVIPPFVVADMAAPSDRNIDVVRRQIAFYGSTPAYHPILELHGLSELGSSLHSLSRQGRWSDMTALIDDEVLDTFAVTVGPADERVRLEERYGALVDRVILYAS